jgi:hypothetical protein
MGTAGPGEVRRDGGTRKQEDNAVEPVFYLGRVGWRKRER